MAKICIGKLVNGPVCNKIPCNINFNSTFVVKIGDGVNSEDKTADNVIYTARSSPIEKVSLKDK